MRLSIDGASLPRLHRAAYEADLATLQLLLEGCADPNEPGCVRDESDGWQCNPGPSYIATPLMLAAASSRRNAAEAIRILLDAGADPRACSTGGDSALWFAARAGNTRGMRVLLERGAPPDQPSANGATPICKAAASGNVNGIRLLLHFGASPHPVAKDEADDPVEPAYPHRIPLFEAAKGGRAECVQLLIDAGARVGTLDICGRTALMYASTAEVVRVLLEAGCALDERDAYGLGLGAIDHAAENGHREVLFALVRAGADINALNEFGMTRLLRYCSSLDVRGDMVRALIKAGADIHATWFRGRTALHEAAQLFGGDRRGKLRDVIIALVEAGLDVNVRDDSFSTPLHYAVGEEGLDLGAVQTLLELGADPALKNDYGQIPLDLAPDHVRRWKRIIAEDRPSVFAGLELPESSIAHLIEEEKSVRARALEEAEEAQRLLGSVQRR